MKIQELKFWIFLFFIFSFSGISAQKYPYQDSSNSTKKRVNDLIARMSLEEKVFQLQSQMKFMKEYKDRDYRVGNVRNIGHFMHINSKEPVTASACAKAINADTKKSIEASRWGIPVLQHGEALHGAQWGNATCFPQTIGMAAMFDDDFYYQIGQTISKELRAVGVRQVLAPVVNVSRDPRWGRTEESYGEDVYLCSKMGLAYTKALEEGGIIATPKHFVDNYSDAGHDSYASNTSWRVLRETYLEPFRVCFVEGGARSVMAAYNSLDGVPCHANSVLLNDILRKEWGFKGFVVSDYSGVNGVNKAHHIAASYPEAQAMCLEAGLDVDLPRGYPDLLKLVQENRISEAQIDESLKRLLICKFNLGLFDDPYVDENEADNIVRCPEHKQMALEAARKIMTLLKNKDGILPLSDKEIKRIGIFGPAANVLSLGDYSGPYGGWKADDAPTPYQAISNRLKGKAEVILHQPGTDVETLAKTCDVVLFFGAINEGEGHDRSKLELPSKSVKAAKSLENAMIVEDATGTTINIDQEKMICDLTKSGIKTIVVLQNGSTVDVRKWIDQVDALLKAWYPGEQGAIAMAETLFGDNNPGGRLPFTWARHAGQLPIYYNIKPSGRGYAYNDDDGKPMFPFGFGLSYTSFEYSDLILPPEVKKDESVKVKFTLKNTGKVRGDEVIQIYLHDEIASVVRPVKEFKAFKRVSLNPGETREIVLSIPYRSFGLWNRDMEFKIEPGDFKVYIGKNTADTLLEGNISLL